MIFFTQYAVIVGLQIPREMGSILATIGLQYAEEFRTCQTGVLSFRSDRKIVSQYRGCYYMIRTRKLTRIQWNCCPESVTHRSCYTSKRPRRWRDRNAKVRTTHSRSAFDAQSGVNTAHIEWFPCPRSWDSTSVSVVRPQCTNTSTILERVRDSQRHGNV